MQYYSLQSQWFPQHKKLVHALFVLSVYMKNRRNYDMPLLGIRNKVETEAGFKKTAYMVRHAICFKSSSSFKLKLILLYHTEKHVRCLHAFTWTNELSHTRKRNVYRCSLVYLEQQLKPQTRVNIHTNTGMDKWTFPTHERKILKVNTTNLCDDRTTRTTEYWRTYWWKRGILPIDWNSRGRDLRLQLSFPFKEQRLPLCQERIKPTMRSMQQWLVYQILRLTILWDYCTILQMHTATLSQSGTENTVYWLFIEINLHSFQKEEEHYDQPKTSSSDPLLLLEP